MKKYIIILIAILPLFAHAQTNSFRQYFKQNADGSFNQSSDNSFQRYFEHNTGREGFVTIEMPGTTISMIKSFQSSQAPSETLKNIEKMSIVICEDVTVANKAEADKMIAEGNYKLITSLNDNGEEVRIYSHVKYKETNSVPKNEFLMRVIDMDNMVIISIIGDIDIKEVSNLAKITK